MFFHVYKEKWGKVILLIAIFAPIEEINDLRELMNMLLWTWNDLYAKKFLGIKINSDWIKPIKKVDSLFWFFIFVMLI